MEGESSRKGAKKGKKMAKATKAAIVAAVRQERNPTLRISAEAPNSTTPSPDSTPSYPNSSSDDENPESQAPNNGNTKFPPRGKAKLLVMRKRKNKDPIPVDFNTRGQPVGENASVFASFIGITARELIPMDGPNWKGLSDEFKTQVWNHITASFIINEVFKKNVVRRMMKLWRDNRSTIIKQVENQAKLVGFQRAASLLKPTNIDSMDQWLAFLKYRTSPQFKKMCEKYSKMRASRELLHKTSRKSFAQLEHEMIQAAEPGVHITRPDVWIRAYEAPPSHNSEGTVEDPELVKQVKNIKASEGPSSQSTSLKDDAVTKVLGPDPRGRVRGLGFGALPSKEDHQAIVGSKVAMLEHAVSTQAQTIATQAQSMATTTLEVAQLKELVTALLARGEKDGSNTIQHSTTSAARYNNEVAQSKTKVASATRVELLSWLDLEELVVATGKIESKDPTTKVHHVPLGHDCWKVWVVDVYEDVVLYRPTREFGTLNQAQGSTIAWPIKYIKLL